MLRCFLWVILFISSCSFSGPAGKDEASNAKRTHTAASLSSRGQCYSSPQAFIPALQSAWNSPDLSHLGGIISEHGLIVVDAPGLYYSINYYQGYRGLVAAQRRQDSFAHVHSKKIMCDSPQTEKLPWWICDQEKEIYKWSKEGCYIEKGKPGRDAELTPILNQGNVSEIFSDAGVMSEDNEFKPLQRAVAYFDGILSRPHTVVGMVDTASELELTLIQESGCWKLAIVYFGEPCGC